MNLTIIKNQFISVIKLRFTGKVMVMFVFIFWKLLSVSAQGPIWFSEVGVNIFQDQKIEWKGGSITKSPAFGYFFNINAGGKKIAGGLQVNYSKPNLKNTNTPGVLNNTLTLWEMYFVMRYYPMLPTMRFGTKAAIRFTAGMDIGCADFYWKGNDGYGTSLKWSPLQFSTVGFVGLNFSPFLNTTGLCVKLNYMPQTLSMQNFPLEKFTLKQPFSLSASIFIGPKIKS